MAHRNARLTPFGRRLLVDRVLVMGWSAAAVADACGVSRACVYKWLRRFRLEGEAGLEDRPSRARICRHALPPAQVQRILRARVKHKVGPHQLAATLGMPRSTIYDVLRRNGLSRLSHIDRPSGVPIRRYQMSRPGELVHIDVKKLARIPDGGGHRMLGRGSGPQLSGHSGSGYDYIHAAVDDHTRLAYSQILHNESGEISARFLLDAAAAFAAIGIRIERIMTDEHPSYTRSHAFRHARQRIDANHITTGPYRPRINGKVERFNRTLIEEWAYARLYTSNDERHRAFDRWLWNYNHNRPHTALGGKSPMDFLLNNGHGNYS